MAGPSANVSRDFWDIQKQVAYLITQQGKPSFDAVRNFNQKNHWMNARIRNEVLRSSSVDIIAPSASTSLGWITQGTTSTSNNFDIGTQDGWCSSSNAGEIIFDDTGSTEIEYQNNSSPSNIMFSGTVSSVASTDIISDTSKNFRASHGLTGSGAAGARLHMTSGAASGNSYPITAITSTSVTATGAESAGVLAADTYVIIPGNLATPSGSDRDDDVYLQLILDDIDEIEDSDLTDPTLNITEAHGLKQAWCVRVDENQAGTFSGEANYTDFIKIGTLARLDGNANVITAMIENDPDKKRIAPFGSMLVASASAAGFYAAEGSSEANIVTVSYEAEPYNRATYQGSTALYDAINALKATDATIFVYAATSSNAYSWDSAITITGNLEIICVGGQVEVDNNVTGTMCTTSGGSLAIRGTQRSAGFKVNDGTGSGVAFSGPSLFFENCDIAGDVACGNNSWFKDVTITPESSTTPVALTLEGSDCKFERLQLNVAEGDDAAIRVDIQTALGHTIFDQINIDMGQSGDETTGRHAIDIKGTDSTTLHGHIEFRNVYIDEIPAMTADAVAVGIINITGLINTTWDGLKIDGYTTKADLRQPLIYVDDPGVATIQLFKNVDLFADTASTFPYPLQDTDSSGLVVVSIASSASSDDEVPQVIFDGCKIRKFSSSSSTPSIGFLLTGQKDHTIKLKNIVFEGWVNTTDSAFGLYTIWILPGSSTGQKAANVYIENFVCDLESVTDDLGTGVVYFRGLYCNCVDTRVRLHVDGFKVLEAINSNSMTNLWALYQPSGDHCEDGSNFRNIYSEGGMIYWEGSHSDTWDQVEITGCKDGIGFRRLSATAIMSHTNFNLSDNDTTSTNYIQYKCDSAYVVCAGIVCTYQSGGTQTGVIDNLAAAAGNNFAAYIATFT